MRVNLGFHTLLAGVLWAGACSAPVQVQPSPAATVPAWLELTEGLRVDRASRTVEVRAWVCLDRGWLEQVLCLPGTREHESLLVTDVVPSSVHAALLLVGLEAGRPGRWVEEAGAVVLSAPLGDRVDVRVRYLDPDSRAMVERDVTTWISDVNTGAVHPRAPWIFGGRWPVAPGHRGRMS